MVCSDCEKDAIGIECSNCGKMVCYDCFEINHLKSGSFESENPQKAEFFCERNEKLFNLYKKKHIERKKATFTILGKCECGNPATQIMQKGIAPGKWTKGKMMCDICFDKELGQA